MIKYYTKKGDEILLDDDQSEIADRSWQLNSVGYPRRTMYSKEKKKTITVLLHRHITGAKKHEIVDHINGNKLDNRRENLRICTQSENLNNRTVKKLNATSRYFGVYKHIEKRSPSRLETWEGSIKINGIKYRKRFKTEIEAAEYYDYLVIYHKSKFHKLNFPEKSIDF